MTEGHQNGLGANSELRTLNYELAFAGTSFLSASA